MDFPRRDVMSASKIFEQLMQLAGALNLEPCLAGELERQAREAG
jgi:hypothetical protein